MKKNIIFGAAFIVISLTNLSAQDGIQVNSSVNSSFHESFQGASNVRWSSLPKGISKAQFSHLGNSYLAYFNLDGDLVATARKIRSINDLPIKVQTAFFEKEKVLAKKNGSPEVLHVYEMLRGGITKYYITMDCPQASLFLSVNNEGMAVIEKKTRKIPELSAPPKDAIAKKN